jgi:hypothetical protein
MGNGNFIICPEPYLPLQTLLNQVFGLVPLYYKSIRKAMEKS